MDVLNVEEVADPTGEDTCALLLLLLRFLTAAEVCTVDDKDDELFFELLP
jgi:hypothetical protein